MKRAFLAATLVAAILAGVAVAGGPSLTNPSSLHAKAPATFTAKFVTTKGTFTVLVTRAWSPIGADRFYNLVVNKFYDNQPLYRVIRGRWVQWGINMTPKIAKIWQHAYIKDDPPVGQHNAKGLMSFANSNAKNSRTTQVFMNMGTNTSLDKVHGFTPFAKITSGIDVFGKLYAGYGDGPTHVQSLFVDNGAHWVHVNYPKMDWITTARVVQ
jgi:cyclophilin family peptidyl-prolyl cis-trans isomerase